MEATTRTPATNGPDGGGRKIGDQYADEHRPLGGYSALSATFGLAMVGAMIAARRSGRELPVRYAASDVAMAGVASHKIARLLSKDKATSFLRAPFVRYQESSGQGEVSEEPRGRGLRLALGELLTCPYCLGQWVTGAYGVGMVAAPRLTRLVGFVYTAETIADFLQLAYKAAEERA